MFISITLSNGGRQPARPPVKPDYVPPPVLPGFGLVPGVCRLVGILNFQGVSALIGGVPDFLSGVGLAVPRGGARLAGGVV